MSTRCGWSSRHSRAPLVSALPHCAPWEVGPSGRRPGEALLWACLFGAAFIKFDGVDGEAQDRDHRDWSDLESFSQAMRRTQPAVEELPAGRQFDFFLLRELD